MIGELAAAKCCCCCCSWLGEPAWFDHWVAEPGELLELADGDVCWLFGAGLAGAMALPPCGWLEVVAVVAGDALDELDEEEVEELDEELWATFWGVLEAELMLVLLLLFGFRCTLFTCCGWLPFAWLLAPPLLEVADINRLSLSGEFKQVCIKALPASDIIIGCSLRVANVYTWPVSEATRSIT